MLTHAWNYKTRSERIEAYVGKHAGMAAFHTFFVGLWVAALAAINLYTTGLAWVLFLVCATVSLNYVHYQIAHARGNRAAKVEANRAAAKFFNDMQSRQKQDRAAV